VSEILSAVLTLIGAGFALLAAVGVARMPDLFTRMQTATKASTLGVSCTILGVALHFGELGIITRALAIIAFFLLTAPVAAHMIGRAAYFVGVPLWRGTIVNELRERYDPETHALRGPESNVKSEGKRAEQS
jgi:multicomponent Na+:H+ antiporter subunit G